jgi:excinuclease ABC subunit B
VETTGAPIAPADLPRDELHRLITELEKEMKRAAQNLEFEKAALLRDQIFELREVMAFQQTGRTDVPIWEQDRMFPIDDDIESGDA